jgi:hypothetical protein
MTIDWSAPLEAYHEDGRVVAVEYAEPAIICTEWSVRPKLDTWHHVFMADGRSVSPVSGWRIRNRRPEAQPDHGEWAKVRRRTRHEWVEALEEAGVQAEASDAAEFLATLGLVKTSSLADRLAEEEGLSLSKAERIVVWFAANATGAA